LSLGGDTASPGALRGDLFALAAAVFVSFYMLFSKLARRTLGGLEAMFWLSVFESGLAFLVVLASGEDFMPKTSAGFLVPLALAIIVQVAGQGLIISGLGSTDTAVAGILVLAQPVVAAAISWSLFEEPLSAIQAAGAAAILIAVWLAQQKQRVRIAAET
ncbi:MAG: DMT family transporter, partial [Hyphomonas sp.]|uniref:EamA family transporter n=1 Tax=Hyphomonas sp. TaxID=87 RepID=UPI00349FDE43